MDLEEYANRARETAEYPFRKRSPLYPALGLAGEGGELANVVKKWMRKTGTIFLVDAEFISTGRMIEETIDEMGDVMWYLVAIADELGVTLTEVAERNLEKLANRQEKGNISEFDHPEFDQ